MTRTETLEGFYQRKLGWIPENIREKTGHFNIFRLAPNREEKPTILPYRRRDFYEMMIVKGSSQVHYADKIIKIKNQALTFSNPQAPYKWEYLEPIREGIYCIFTPHFFYQFVKFQHYEVFQIHGTRIFELRDEQFARVYAIFEQMLDEYNSDYKYKYDRIRNLIFEVIHFGLKQESSVMRDSKAMTASQRIFMLFYNLLERQFPIDSLHQTLGLRSASEFAFHLNVHVNHLNRAVKETTDKTTTEIISNRILQEAKVLLHHTTWNISEIAFALGFKEVSHFNSFFKKQLKMNPSQFRNR